MSPIQKTILITGVSRGLGRALAEEFIRLGHTVLGCGRSEKEIGQLQKQFAAPHDFAVVDVASDGQVGRVGETYFEIPRRAGFAAEQRRRSSTAMRRSGKFSAQEFSARD